MTTTVGNLRMVCKDCKSVDITPTRSKDCDKPTPLVCKECGSMDMSYVEDAFGWVELDRLRKASSKASKKARKALKKLAAFLDG